MKKEKRGFLRTFWYRQSLERQIFFSMSVFTMVFALVIIFAVSQVSERQMESQYREAYAHSLKESSRIADLQMSPLIELARTALMDSEVADVLLSSKEDGNIEFQGRRLKIIRDYLNGVTSQSGLIANAAIIDLAGHGCISNNLNSGTYSFYVWCSEHNVEEESFAQAARAAKGKEVFFGEPLIVTAGGVHEISLVKYLLSPDTAEPMGYLVMNISGSLFRRALSNDAGDFESCSYMVLDGNGSLVYDDVAWADSDSLASTFLSDPESSGHVFLSVKNATTGWTFVNSIDRRELVKKSGRIVPFLLVFSIVMIGLVFLLSKLISRSMTGPLSSLEETIRLVGAGNRHVTNTFDDSEVGKIGQTFVEMVNNNLVLSDRLKDSELKEREAEILLLQSQINPHFLYNALDSLYCVAVIDGNDRIADMTLALSDNFKLSLNNGRKDMAVEDEVRKVEAYVKVQNMRFHDRFTFETKLDPAMAKKQMITFVLQPFVENAIVHGLEPKIGDGWIRLTGTLAEDGQSMIFVIEDNGVGTDDPGKLENGYGINNVRDRIQLLYGKPYGIHIDSRKNHGTKVTITLPVLPDDPSKEERPD